MEMDMILLDTPLSLGCIDEHPYTHARIVKFLFDAQDERIMISIALGYLVDGAFVPGLAFPGKTQFSAVVQDDAAAPEPTSDFSDLLSKQVGAEPEATTYGRVVHELYSYVLARGIVVGTIVSPEGA
jgi:hypothetical protein